MDLRIVRSSEMQEQKWGFGTTKQIYISPITCDFGSQEFDYRLSIAQIDDENAKFSILNDVNRIFFSLMPISLSVNGEEKSLKEYESLTFSGEDEVVSHQKGEHFNVMIRNKNFEAAVQHLRLKPGEFITEKIQDHIFYYVYNGSCIVKDFSVSEVLHKGDLITINPKISNTRLKILSEKEIELIRVDLFYRY